MHAFQDADHEGGTPEEAERLTGEPSGPESGGDHGERLHGQLTGKGIADAKSTPDESIERFFEDKRFGKIAPD